MWRCNIVTRNNLCPPQGPQGPGQAHLCPGPAPEHNLQNFVLAAGHLVLDSCDLALRTQIGCLNITYQSQRQRQRQFPAWVQVPCTECRMP